MLPTINILKQPTLPAWVDLAISNLDEILLDHSQCERKAASAAIAFMFRYPSNAKMVKELTKIAKEELEHFEQVNQWLDKRGIALRPVTPPPYGAKLKAQIRPTEPNRFLDSLLVSALIEARSHERLGLLAQHCPEPDLAKFYQGLMASEARHYGIYWVLADTYYDREIVMQRLDELSIAESEILATLYYEPRIHS
ncbi:hydroxylase for synthesis of 2-methylthio-cis-ribozeatin in tRNA [Rivularia sp. PCC 7116]|nr:hydroxylase for synthesis of 2-methylthio-cis-ribozeatin in tRNA [Rivularia sp. PCC 7116]